MKEKMNTRMKEQLKRRKAYIVGEEVQIKHDKSGPAQECQEAKHQHPECQFHQPSQQPLFPLLLLFLSQVLLKDLLQKGSG